jgi:hypothetical protein
MFCPHFVYPPSIAEGPEKQEKPCKLLVIRLMMPSINRFSGLEIEVSGGWHLVCAAFLGFEKGTAPELSWNGNAVFAFAHIATRLCDIREANVALQ